MVFVHELGGRARCGEALAWALDGIWKVRSHCAFCPEESGIESESRSGSGSG